MKRGFKAAAERRAIAERAALGLSARCRLDPVALAEAKGIPVIPIGALPGVPPEHLRHLREVNTKAFSAAAVLLGADALIAVNDSHTAERQANSIAHELAHLLLEHPADQAFGDFGSRTLNKDHEDEADWLAGCLLVPGSGIAGTLSDCGADLVTAAAHYGVSIELMRWRHNMTKPRRPSRPPAARC